MQQFISKCDTKSAANTFTIRQWCSSEMKQCLSVKTRLQNVKTLAEVQGMCRKVYDHLWQAVLMCHGSCTILPPAGRQNNKQWTIKTAFRITSTTSIIFLVTCKVSNSDLLFIHVSRPACTVEYLLFLVSHLNCCLKGKTFTLVTVFHPVQ